MAISRLAGGTALSGFRLEKLNAALGAAAPGLRVVSTQHWHFVETDREASDADRAVLERLLRYGPDAPPPSTYCPAPYEQLVVQWNGDVTTCCTDYEGRTKTANVFAQSIESVWTGDILKQRKRDMLEGRLLDVCAKCMGVPAAR